MKSFISKFLFIIPLSFLILASPTEAAVITGQTCAAEGASTISDNKTTIAVCLRKSTTDATLVWKGMTSESNEGDTCGLAVVGFRVVQGSAPSSNVEGNGGGYRIGDEQFLSPQAATIFPCQGKAFTFFHGPTDSPTAYITCPTGYAMHSAAAPVGMGLALNGLDSLYFLTCLKK